MTVGPLYVIYRTAALNKRLEQIAGRGRWVWRILLNIGVAVGFGQMLLISLYLIRNAFNLFFRTEQAGAVQVLIPIPGITMSWQNFPYVVAALCILVVTHEAAHAIGSLVESISLKSAGLFFAVIVVPFVELDDEIMEKSKYSSRLRIFAAGSASNLAVAMIALILLSNFAGTISPLYEVIPSGLQVGGLTEGYPAEAAGIRPGDIIQAINSVQVPDIDGLRDVMRHVKPGESVKVETNSGAFELVTASDPSDPERAVLGVTQLTNHVVYIGRLPFLSPYLPRHLFNVEYWVYFLSISAAIFNMLPLSLLDGGKYLAALLDAFGLRSAKRISSAINGLSFIILAANLLLSYTVFGFTKL